MNTHKPDIEQYLNAARNAEPVMNLDEIESLIESADAGQYIINERKKIRGVRPMYIVTTTLSTAAAIGIIAVGISTFDNNSNTDSRTGVWESGQKEKIPSLQKIESLDGGKNNISINSENKQSNIETKPVIEMKKLDVKGINVIELSKDELEKIGIESGSDGSLKFAALKETKKPLLVQLTKNTLTTVLGDKETEALPSVSPRFITDEFGNRRLSLFTEMDGGMLIEASYAAMYEPTTDNNKIEKKQVKAFKMTNDGESDSSSKSRLEIIYNKDKDEYIESLKIKVGDSLVTAHSITSKYDPKLKGTVHKIETDEEAMKIANENIFLNDLDEYTDGTEGYKEIIYNIIENALNKHQLDKAYLDSIVGQSKMYLNNHVFIKASEIKHYADSISKKINEKMNKTKVKIKIKKNKINEKDTDGKPEKQEEIIENEIVINLDSIMNKIEFNLDELEEKLRDIDININIDTFMIKKLEKDLEKHEEKFKKDEEKFKRDEEKFKLKQEKFKDMEKRMEEMLRQAEENFESYIRVNKLIPIAIKFDDQPSGMVPNRSLVTSSDKKYDYILWFDPTPELIDKLPVEVRQRLEPEVLAAKDTKQFCEKGMIAGYNPYLDVWRSCSGAIENLSVFPNPASGRINVKFNLKEGRNLTIVLHNLDGRVVRTLKEGESVSSGEFEGKFQIKGLEPGMYLLSVQSSSGEYAVQRIIVN